MKRGKGSARWEVGKGEWRAEWGGGIDRGLQAERGGVGDAKGLLLGLDGGDR